MSVIVAEGVVVVTADGKGIPKQIGKDVESNSSAVEKSGGTLGGKIGGGIKTGLVSVGKAVGVTLLAATAAVGVGVGAIITKGVAFNAAMQNYVAAFTPLLGGADKAQAKLLELSSFAASTPFTLEGLAGSSQTLLSFGEDTKKLLPDLKMLGDISQGNQTKLSGLALVFGQVQSNGHLMGQDLLQMINQGFNPLPIIAAKTGESMSALRARMAAGKITFDEVHAAMVSATSAGGMFYGSMALGAQTLTGAWSSTGDGANILSGAITKTLTPALTGLLSLGVNPMLAGLFDLISGVSGAKGTVTDASAAMLAQVQLLGPAMVSIAKNIGIVFTAIAPSLGVAVQALLDSIITLLPGLIGIASQIVTSLVTGLVGNLPQLVATAVPMIMAFVGSLVGMLPALIQTGVDVLLALITGITTSLPVLIPQVVTAVVGAITTLFQPGNLTALLSAGLALIIGLVTGLLKALPSLIAALPAIIVGIITFLVNAIPTLIQAGIKLFLALIGALPQIITAIVKAIPQIIIGLVLALTQAIPKIITAGISLFISLIKNLPTIIATIVKAIPQIVIGIAQAFTNPKTIAQISNAGGQLIKGLWNGISDLASWLWGKISGFMGTLTSKIKGFFGIHSPSALFRDEIGAMLGRGMADGILGTAGLVSDAASGLADAAMTGIGGVGITVTGAPGAGIGTGGTPPSYPGPPPAAGSTHVTIENITIDASSIEEFNDIVDMVKELPQVARSGPGTGKAS